MLGLKNKNIKNLAKMFAHLEHRKTCVRKYKEIRRTWGNNLARKVIQHQFCTHKMYLKLKFANEVKCQLDFENIYNLFFACIY